MCEDQYGADLHAVDLEDGSCYCYDDCRCMNEVGDSTNELSLMTREMEDLPTECDSED